MVVTAAVFQLEMSALKAPALENTVGGCRCRGGQNPKIINKNRENVKKSNRSEWNSKETTETRVDVLDLMLVTAAVFQLEISLLNAEVP